MYLTYDEYQDMGGTLEETAFTNYCWEAQTLVDWYTFQRLHDEEEVPEAVKRCVYRLIQLAQLKADAMMLGLQTDSTASTTATSGNPIIAAQSNDGVSISYNVISASEVFRALSSRGTDNPIESTIRQYLDGIKNSLGRKLLYRGLYPGE